MDLSRLLLPGLAVLLILAVLPVLRAAPLRQITRAGANSLLGLGALLLVNLTAPLTGVSLGFNLFNALVTLVLGVPGLGLLLLVGPYIAFNHWSCVPVPAQTAGPAFFPNYFAHFARIFDLVTCHYIL